LAARGQRLNFLSQSIAEHFGVCLKTKKITDISQTQAGFKARSRRNPLWIQGFLTQNPVALIETDQIFDFSDTP